MSADAPSAPRRGRIRHHLGWQVASNLGVAAIGGVYLIYLGRALGLEEFGLYALVTAIAIFAFNSTDPRTHEGIVKFTAHWTLHPAAAGRALSALFIADCFARVGVCLLLAVTAPLVASVLLPGSSAGLLLVAIIGTFLAKLGNNPAIGVLRVFGRFEWQAHLLLSSWIIKLLATLVAIASGGGILAVLLIAYTCDTAANFLAIARAAQELRTAGLWTWLRSGGRESRLNPEIKRFLQNGVGVSLADSFIRELDTTVVGWSMPLEAVGIYRMAKNVVLLVWRGLDPVCVVLMPEFARLAAAGNYSAIIRIGTKATGVVLIVALVALVACWALLPFVIPIVLGPQFAGVTSATVIMLAGLVVGAPLMWNYALWVAAGRLGMQLLANVLAGLSAGALFVILTPRYGVHGASTAFAVAISMPFVLSFVLWQVYSRRTRLG